MTFLSLSKSPLPEYVVLDIEPQAVMIGWLCEEHHEDEAALYDSLVQCLTYERDSEYELEHYLALFQEQCPDGGRFIPVLRQTMTAIYQQAKALRLYEQQRLNYAYGWTANGNLVLARTSGICDEADQDEDRYHGP